MYRAMRAGVIGNPSWACLPLAAHQIFETGQLLDTDRASRVHLAGGNTDLGTHSEFTAVGKLG